MFFELLIYIFLIDAIRFMRVEGTSRLTGRKFRPEEKVLGLTFDPENFRKNQPDLVKFLTKMTFLVFQ